ncbi:MAG TPA: hypothetical protein PK379_11735 [Candidatus Hydrogenedentes bacterium]|nr:hypothetical protein [Candidatus Hydrogenedentota bacterium]
MDGTGVIPTGIVRVVLGSDGTLILGQRGQGYRQIDVLPEP